MQAKISESGKNKQRAVKEQPPVLPKGERGNKMSDCNGESAFNEAARYPYYNGGKTVINAREREFPIKEKAPNLGKRRGRGEGGVGETRREREKLRFSLSQRVSPTSRVTTQ